MATVVVAMSGGVDSSLTAALLVEQGHEVIGINMRLHGSNSDEEEQNYSLNKSCCSIVELEDARRVCQQIGIPFYAMNFEKEFRQSVIEYFIEEYERGRTPNPCVACNAFLKFRFLLDKALALGADYLATGHYARNVFDPTTQQYKLLRAVDASKDQSYVLYMLNQKQLSRILFPLGEYTKTQARQMAAQRGLATAAKPESQDICFVAGGDYRDYIKNRLSEGAATPGPIINLSGEVVGQHNGLPNYTIGQRKGIGIYAPTPTYVLKVVNESNTLVVGDDRDLFQREFEVENINWINGEWSKEPVPATVKIRYKAREASGTVQLLDSETRKARLVLDNPQRAITPGQAAVFYQGDEVLGGGVIC
ncbi:MAG: tRNA 2-thiouridine(34) synthase MnmA [Chloroflexi bacterium]|uniref:tRNA-specific 2-thiouridylase MnmA n=1 Tax=Candidatus Chlorohelix allophototropha TaxID=3003348 RepID=A0A8T7M8K0_9CHLR|nr:tRNA 2-thiouridine(34) synthase MnmA [Chloroflexota bacterium]WJW68421.1 tRNA 2-thiouridine(34) synthase MnmA [Chloroflexota bacterium L227-S17]